MTTTGHTPTSNIEAMITGYEDLEEVDEMDVSDKQYLNKKLKVRIKTTI
jgi:hypothetical protein